MKKIIIALLITLSILITGCNNEKSGLDFSFSEHIGTNLADIYEALDISQDELTEDTSPGMFCFNAPVSYNGTDLTKYLLFTVADDTLYGGGYFYITDGKSDAAWNLLQNIKNELTERYGEPTTYPGLANRISVLENFDDCKSPAEYTESWSTADDNDGEIKLSLVTLENRTSIQAQYTASNLK
ncbi:MAG: hypothetical protein E7401_04100 [Ruminococcaceae bacterium]|nr:hypothetical protein [Oscillospiraceae bacterium]